MDEVTVKNVRSYLTEAQQTEFKEAFALFDKNGDGSISRDELKVVLDALGTNTTEENLDRLILEVDKDGNGEIDIEEFMLMMYRQVQGVQSNKESDVREAFLIFDTNKEGLITTDTLTAVLSSLGESPTNLGDLEELLSNLVQTSDGKIRLEDLVKLLSM